MKTCFGPFTLDSDTRQLRRAGVEVHLPRKAFELLSVLLAARPKVMNKDELHATLWPDSHIDAAGLNVLVSDVRRALGDEARRPQFIRTVHGVGYAFCGEAVHGEESAAAPAASACWLAWGDRTLKLASGENVIGRDPQCSVWLDGERVSRRHASIRVDAPAATAYLTDLGCTNGTFVGRRRVVDPVALRDGDEIKVGSIVLTFRLWFPDRAAETRRVRRRDTPR